MYNPPSFNLLKDILPKEVRSNTQSISSQGYIKIDDSNTWVSKDVTQLKQFLIDYYSDYVVKLNTYFQQTNTSVKDFYLKDQEFFNNDKCKSENANEASLENLNKGNNLCAALEEYNNDTASPSYKCCVKNIRSLIKNEALKSIAEQRYKVLSLMSTPSEQSAIVDNIVSNNKLTPSEINQLQNFFSTDAELLQKIMLSSSGIDPDDLDVDNGIILEDSFNDNITKMVGGKRKPRIIFKKNKRYKENAKLLSHLHLLCDEKTMHKKNSIEKDNRFSKREKEIIKKGIDSDNKYHKQILLKCSYISEKDKRDAEKHIYKTLQSIDNIGFTKEELHYLNNGHKGGGWHEVFFRKSFTGGGNREINLAMENQLKADAINAIFRQFSQKRIQLNAVENVFNEKYRINQIMSDTTYKSLIGANDNGDLTKLLTSLVKTSKNQTISHFLDHFFQVAAADLTIEKNNCKTTHVTSQPDIDKCEADIENKLKKLTEENTINKLQLIDIGQDYNNFRWLNNSINKKFKQLKTSINFQNTFVETIFRGIVNLVESKLSVFFVTEPENMLQLEEAAAKSGYFSWDQFNLRKAQIVSSGFTTFMLLLKHPKFIYILFKALNHIKKKVCREFSLYASNVEFGTATSQGSLFGLFNTVTPGERAEGIPGETPEQKANREAKYQQKSLIMSNMAIQNVQQMRQFYLRIVGFIASTFNNSVGKLCNVFGNVISTVRIIGPASSILISVIAFCIEDLMDEWKEAVIVELGLKEILELFDLNNCILPTMVYGMVNYPDNISKTPPRGARTGETLTYSGSLNQALERLKALTSPTDSNLPFDRLDISNINWRRKLRLSDSQPEGAYVPVPTFFKQMDMQTSGNYETGTVPELLPQNEQLMALQTWVNHLKIKYREELTAESMRRKERLDVVRQIEGEKPEEEGASDLTLEQAIKDRQKGLYEAQKQRSVEQGNAALFTYGRPTEQQQILEQVDRRQQEEQISLEKQDTLSRMNEAAKFFAQNRGQGTMPQVNNLNDTFGRTLLSKTDSSGRTIIGNSKQPEIQEVKRSDIQNQEESNRKSEAERQINYQRPGTGTMFYNTADIRTKLPSEVTKVTKINPTIQAIGAPPQQGLLGPPPKKAPTASNVNFFDPNAIVDPLDKKFKQTPINSELGGSKNKTHKFYKKTHIKTKRNRQLLSKLKKYNKTKRGHK